MLRIERPCPRCRYPNLLLMEHDGPFCIGCGHIDISRFKKEENK